MAPKGCRMPRRPVKAEQIARELGDRIQAGEFAGAAWLPTLRELSRTYAVNERTVSSGLQMLAEQGLVELVAGQGARTVGGDVLRRDASDITRQQGLWRGFHTTAAKAGAEPYTNTYRIGDTEADIDVAGRLGVPMHSPVLERARLQGVVVDGERRPIQLSTTWIIPEVVDRLPILRDYDTGPGGMGSRMAEAGYRITYEDVVTARIVHRAEQESLSMSDSGAVLVAWRRAFDENSGRPLEVTLRVINPDLHELVYRYS